MSTDESVISPGLCHSTHIFAPAALKHNKTHTVPSLGSVRMSKVKPAYILFCIPSKILLEPLDLRILKTSRIYSLKPS